MCRKILTLIFLLGLNRVESSCDAQWRRISLTNSFDTYTFSNCRQSVCVNYKKKPQDNNSTDIRHWYEEQNTYPSDICSLIITNSTLNSIEEKMFPETRNIIQLFLNKTSIKEIHSNAFQEFQTLNELYLQDNHLEILNEYTFHNLHTLGYLFLHGNNLRVLKNPFKSTPELLLLKLNDNKLETLEQSLFDPIPELKFLDISNNPFKKISHVELYLFQFNARGIGLNSLQLNQITDSKEILINLNASDILTLDISRNHLTQLNSSSFTNLHYLTSLDLSGNSIEIIDGSAFTYLQKLQHLNLSNNKIKALPQKIFQNLTHLQTLDLSGNRLRNIQPGLFDHLNTLRVLNLSSNDIEKVNLLGHRSRIYMDLYLDNNDLKELTLNNFDGIRKITLDNNMWHCKTLDSIISYLEEHEVEIVDGSSSTSKNSRQIACDDNSTFVSFNQTYIQNNDEIKAVVIDTKMTDFLNEGFVKSAFYKYFNNFTSSALTFNQYYKDSVETLKNISNHFLNISKPTLDNIKPNFLRSVEKNGSIYDSDNSDSLRTVLILISIALYSILCVMIVFLYMKFKAGNYSLISLSRRNLNMEMI